MLELREVGFEHRGRHRGGQARHPGEAEEDVLAERVAEEPRHLRDIRGPRRHEERRRIGDEAAVPADVPGLAREEAKEHAQERRLPRADAAGHHREGPALDRERDVRDPRPAIAHARAAREAIAEPAHLEPPQRQDGGSGRGRGAGALTRQRADEIEPRVPNQRVGRHARRATAHQGEHPRDRDSELLVLGQEEPDEAAEVRDEAEIRHEQGEIADGEAAIVHRAGAEQEDEAGAHVDRVPVDRLREQTEAELAEDRAAAQVAQPAKVLDDPAFGARDLDRLDRAEDLAQRSGHAARRLLARGARALQAARRDLRHEDDQDHRDENENRDRRVDPDEDRDREDREHRVADHVDRPVGAVLGVLDIVAEDA